MFKNKKKFTMIELMITICIIIILISMLLPALNRARGKAKSIKCINNLKQYGLGFMYYAQDNDDYTPRAYNFEGSLTWYQRILPYLNRKNLLRCPAETVNAIWTNYGFNHRLGYMKLTRLCKYKDYWLLVDAKWYFINPPVQVTSDNVELRHLKRANVLYPCGHVDSQTLAGINKLYPFNGYPLTQEP